MSPAPNTGRTAEEMRAELAALRVENEALRTANAQLADDDWEPHPSLSAKRGETIGHVVKPERYKALLAAEQEAATLRARLQEAERDREAWKRVAVIAAIPLEAMRMAGSYRALAPSTQTCVDEAVVTIRMAVTGHSLPPEGDLDAGLAPARAALATPVPQTQEAGDHEPR